MASPQEKPMHANETWPLRDEYHGYAQDVEETMISCYGCACIGGLCWWRRRNGGVEGHGYLLQQQQQEVEGVIRESWVKRNAKKLKEISEVLAGPRWKNFIRRISKRRSSSLSSSSMQFQYDPRSYELNFDEGIYREVDDGIFPDFTARFAAPAAGIHKG